MAISLAGRSLLSIADLTREEVEEIWRVAAAQKSGEVSTEEQLTVARGRTLAMIFDKSSLRTRLGFEVAMAQLGGHGLYLAPADARIGEREPVRDVARVLGRAVDAIAARLHSRGEEITDEVLDGPQCAAFDQSENRLHTQRALLALIFS